MRAAVLGMGAIGQLFARSLEAGGADVVRVDRTRAPRRADEAPVEVALVTTKTPGTEWAAEQAAHLLTPDGLAITMQNGLGNVERLAMRLGRERVGVGVVVVGAMIVGDGTLTTTGPAAVEIGRARGVDDLASALERGGMTVRLLDDPWPAVWRKVIANCALNPLTALFSCTNGELLTHPAAIPLADELAREAAHVAGAAGVVISEHEAVETWRAVAQTTATNRNSMRVDVEAGRETEIDAINGEVAQRARAAGLRAPANEAVRLLVTAFAPSR